MVNKLNESRVITQRSWYISGNLYSASLYSMLLGKANILKHFRNAPFYILLFLPLGWIEDIFLVIFYVRVQ